jgi:hypothetical protein
MIPRRKPNQIVSALLFWGAVLFASALILRSTYNRGVEAGVEVGVAKPKVCASVPGQQVVSSTADTCTYASAYGRATKKRKAI